MKPYTRICASDSFYNTNQRYIHRTEYVLLVTQMAYPIESGRQKADQKGRDKKRSAMFRQSNA